jgi:hypothetical protein
MIGAVPAHENRSDPQGPPAINQPTTKDKGGGWGHTLYYKNYYSLVIRSRFAAGLHPLCAEVVHNVV